MKQTYILMITVALLLASTAVLADATDDKLAADLKGRIESGGTHRVIVSHDASFGSSDLDALRNRGERLRRNHPGIGGFSADLSSEAIEDLASDPRVLSISPDRKVVGNLDVTVPTVGADTIADRRKRRFHRQQPVERGRVRTRHSHCRDHRRLGSGDVGSRHRAEGDLRLSSRSRRAR
jgi:hypothetical protein